VHSATTLNHTVACFHIFFSEAEHWVLSIIPKILKFGLDVKRISETTSGGGELWLVEPVGPKWLNCLFILTNRFIAILLFRRFQLWREFRKEIINVRVIPHGWPSLIEPIFFPPLHWSHLFLLLQWYYRPTCPILHYSAVVASVTKKWKFIEN